jgi:hypothetical protein
MPKMPDGEYPWRSLGGKLKMGMEIADLADFYRFLMFFWFQRFSIFPRMDPFGGFLSHRGTVIIHFHGIFHDFPL